MLASISKGPANSQVVHVVANVTGDEFTGRGCAQARSSSGVDKVESVMRRRSRAIKSIIETVPKTGVYG